MWVGKARQGGITAKNCTFLPSLVGCTFLLPEQAKLYYNRLAGPLARLTVPADQAITLRYGVNGWQVPTVVNMTRDETVGLNSNLSLDMLKHVLSKLGVQSRAPAASRTLASLDLASLAVA